MATSKNVERIPDHYGLAFVLANSQATILEVIAKLAKRNRVEKSNRKVVFTPKAKMGLQLQLKERQRIRRVRENDRRGGYFK